MKKIKLITILLILTVLLSPIVPQKNVVALEFEPSNIISNYDMLDYNSMNLVQIYEFLKYQNGVLKSYHTVDYFGETKSASEVIYEAAQNYKINPKWILATLQKEQSLITNPVPSLYNLNWAMGYAVCDSCSVDDPRVLMFIGFGTQVDRATWRIKYYYNNPEKFNYRAGLESNIDGTMVRPQNQATANLYNYTPHLHGNYNFWKIWNRWFAKIHPDGSLLRQEGQVGVWLIENGKKRPFWSKTALISRYDESKIIDVSYTDLQRYTHGYPIKYSNYSLLKDPSDNIYLIVNNERKEIESTEVFRTIGFNYEEVIDVTHDEISHYQEGKKITLNSVYPQGALLQDNISGGVYYVEDGIKHPIIDREILKANYPNYKITPINTDELNKYLTALTVVKFNDGILVKTIDHPEVYVVSNSTLRPIANEETFKQLGYKWIDVVQVSERVINAHSKGMIVDLFFRNDTQIASI